MAIVKSKLLKQLSGSYPNFLKKDIEKFLNIILNEIKKALKRGERVELRGFGIGLCILKKLEFQEIPKQEKKFKLQKKKQFTLKWQKNYLIN